MSRSEFIPNINERETLEHFAARYLKMPVMFKARMNQTIQHLYLHLEKLPGFSIDHIFRGGSMGKVTAVKTMADIDLIIFFKGYRSMSAFIKDKDTLILPAIKRHLTKDPVYSRHWKCTSTSKGYHVTLEMDEYKIKVDIVPAIKVIGATGDMTKVYEKLASEPERARPHYSACLAPKQCKFMNNQPQQVKTLIKLVKYWKESNNLKLKSYLCELLAVHVFRKDLDKNTSFKLKDGMKHVLRYLKTYETLKIKFRDYYVPDHWKQYRPSQPYVLDPANPFMNTCTANSSEVSKIKTCAKKTLSALR
ncbi:2'-5'-oligoadenylate synthase 1A [Patella vulgata]|uniref:2'-5'-oligoadenylate synthase 1A n=1 Tax=Patella vulgata TaxID=6465 RepID=UPI0024A7C1A3|nr:2'-5'-oligoadenylate synthase 1A [Patella vulgata]XP_050394050.2 2'-5'-oligoadenylate synthase 1A [Patella vulgata]